MFLWGKRSARIKRAEELIDECCNQLGLATKKLGRGAREVVARRGWTEGSEEEMRRFIYYAAISAGDVIEKHHFRPVYAIDHESISGNSFEDMALEEIVGQKVDHFFTRMGNVEPKGVYEAVMKQVERPLLKSAINWADGKQLKAARVLGINRNTLRRKLRELGIK